MAWGPPPQPWKRQLVLLSLARLREAHDAGNPTMKHNYNGIG